MNMGDVVDFQHLWLKEDGVPDTLYSAMLTLQSGQERYRNPFFRPEFIQIMSHVRQDVHLFWGEDEKGLTFYWAMHLNKAGHARGIGGPFSDRNGPVIREGFGFDLSRFLESSCVKKFTTNGFMAPPNMERYDLSPILNNEACIDKPFDLFYEEIRSQHASLHKKLRRLQRKLESECEAVTFTFDDTSPEAMQWLMDAKSQQYKDTGRHDVLGPKWVQDMFSSLRDYNNPDFKLCVSTLKTKGDFIAAEINLRSHSTLHGWIVGYNPNYKAYSPGYLIIMKILSEFNNQGLTYYDFGPGSEEYKKYFVNLRTPLKTGTLYAPNTSHLLEDAWSQAEERAPEKLSNLLQKTRRRSDQILATEIAFIPRVKGFIRAIQTSL